MDRYWLLTWRTYGTWLPGEHGFVSDFRNPLGQKVLLNVPGELPADAMPRLAAYSADIMDETAVRFDLAQATAISEQLRETARFRRWQVLALAVIPDHVHVVVGVPGDPDPEKLLVDFKAWCTRRLNRECGRRKHWWVESGSRRKKDTPETIRAAVEYVRDQPGALVVWLDPRVTTRLAELANGTA